MYYPGIGVGGSGGVAVSKMLKFYVKVFYVMGRALSGGLCCPCDRSCFNINSLSVSEFELQVCGLGPKDRSIAYVFGILFSGGFFS